jgi:hypothetical protein
VTERLRKRLGITGVALGVAMLGVGVAIAHFSGLPETNAVGREIYPHIPRCAWFETGGSCWVIPTSGQVVAVGGSQLLFAGVVVGWILDRPLTWARAPVAALLTTVEMIVLFGVVPNQWLSLTQGTFEWTAQKTAFTLPRWLMLNNEVGISYGAIKDIVSGGYSAVMLGLIAVTAYQLQERGKRRGAPAPAKVSSYGRPIVKGQ